MAIKFEKIEPGIELFDIHSETAGNTTMKRIGVWKVKVLTVGLHGAEVSWNGNAPTFWHKHRLTKLYVKIPPKLQEKINKQRW